MDDKTTNAVARLARSIADLDLESLPERLDDTELAMVTKVAFAPLPALPPASEQHVAQALRMMLAVLPRQQSDDLAGELFVEAYCRQLGHMPAEQISYLVDQATKQCHWFPTIVKCLEIASGWRRLDADALRASRAFNLRGKELAARDADSEAGWRNWKPDQAELDRIKRDVAAKFPSNRG